MPYLESALCLSEPVAIIQTYAKKEKFEDEVSSVTNPEPKQSRKATGLELLYSNGENDELLAGSELILLPTPSQQSTKVRKTHIAFRSS